MCFFTKISKSREGHLKIVAFFTVKAIVLTLITITLVHFPFYAKIQLLRKYH